MKLSASPWKPMPTIIMNATGCMPSSWPPPIRLPAAMQNADDRHDEHADASSRSSAVRLRISAVTAPTVSTTTAGFTLAYHDGAESSPAMRSTYLGMLA